MGASDQPTAFVLMPFTPEFDALFDRLIGPALEDAGYRCLRADSVLDQQNVMRDVVSGIGGARLVIAELTGLNPNVLYEVGLAHGLRIPTILLAQSVQDVPFDLRGYRIQEYSTRFDEIDVLRDSLTTIAAEHLAGKVVFGSPVIDFLDGVASGDVQGSDGQGSEPIVSEDLGQMGFLDWLADWEESADQLGEISVRIGGATTDVGDDLRGHGEKLTELQGSDSPGTAVKARRIASMAASDLARYAERLENELPAFEATIDKMVEGGINYLQWVSVETDEDREGLAEAESGIQEMLIATQGALQGVGEMRSELIGITGASVELDRALRRAAKSLAEVISLLEKTESFCHRALAVLEEKMSSEVPSVE